MPRIKQGNLTKQNGRWYGHFSMMVFDPTTGGKRKKQRCVVLGPVKGTSEKKARLLLRDAITAEAGVTGDGRVTLEGFTKSVWIPLHEGRWRSSSKETILQKLGVIYEPFRGVALADIDSVMVTTWLNGLAGKYAAQTVRLYHSYIRSIFNEALQQDYLRKDPTRLLRVPRNLKTTKRPFLSMDEIAMLLDAAKPFGVPTMEYAVLMLMLTTGLRPGEALALKWADLDLNPEGTSTIQLRASVYRGKLRNFTKTREEGEDQRKILPVVAAQTLLHWFTVTHHQEQNDYVFVDSRGGFLHAVNYLSRVLKPLAKRAGIKTPLTFQVLRRTFGTYAAEIGSLQTTSEMLGHKQMQTTSRYYVQTLSEVVRGTTEALAEKFTTHRPAVVN